MQLTNGMLLPLLQMSTALGIADAVNPQLRLEKLAGGLRTAVTWILGTMMALFSALLSVRTFVASAADSLAAKSVRLLTAGMIPIVGSAVSDAYGTVQGSIRLLRNGTGAVGIIVIILLTVPPLLSLLLHRAVFWRCRCSRIWQARNRSRSSTAICRRCFRQHLRCWSAAPSC